MSRDGERRRDESQTVVRALQLLDLVASSTRPLTTGSLATTAGLSRPTAYRLLVTLEREGYLDRTADGAFALGYKATRLGGANGSQQALARRARPILEALLEEVNETVGLSVPVGAAVVEIDQIDPPHPVRQITYINEAFPLHCTSNGKVMLAALPDSELDAYLSRPLERRTPHTITSPDRLRQELDTVRRAAYGTDLEELYEGINGVSAAVRDSDGHPIAFVSVSGPSFRLSKARLRAAATPVQHACDQIQHVLTPPSQSAAGGE